MPPRADKRLTASQLLNRALICTCLGLILLVSLVWNPGETRLFSCYFRELTGYPCPSCGLTRSFHAIAHLEFQQAVKFHPMGLILYATLLLFLFITLMEIILKRAIRVVMPVWMKITAFGGVFAFWAVWWIIEIFRS
ncbi:MAG: DUF2752 domain-containing protein [candidate division KSB1 bacterium]|nr:DUF2752 domain-containing protein [candidate division KSB1 bacterium]MDZ7356076.1 DUF2752 domain-containing protein [candidate division KSB1 bacterium]MDZ7375511.1 DUF2752 domain-containing protein [candidate division KSB1 bacterium]MDZ7400593.1 DUF2752 domain-containing protein [candidate division KSB1 bacterium]